MEHNDIRRRLSEYIDGSVTGEERAEIDAHLKTCIQCSSALEELTKTIAQIKIVDEIEPPVWMTQKIMAAVRAEAEEGKGFFHRLFFPLRIKLPIQAIAVLFLAVTGFYLYQNIQPAEKISEAPLREFAAKKQAPPVGAAQDKLAEAVRPALRSKQVPQAPAYNALDMKQEYETPPPPVPAEKAAGTAADGSGGQPAPAHDEMTSKKRIAAPQAAAPAPSRPSAETALQAGGAQGAAAPIKKSKAALEDNKSLPVIFITVSVKDMETAARDTDAAIRQLGGAITTTEQTALKRIYTATLSANRRNDLLKKLNRIGDVKEKATTPDSREGRVQYRIELVEASGH